MNHILWSILDGNTWSWVEPNKTVTVSYDLTCEVLQSNVVHSKPNKVQSKPICIV